MKKASILLPSLSSLLLAIFSCASAQNQTTTESDANPRELVVGGEKVSQGTYPYFATSAGNSFCGASVIHSDILLTAAHCGSFGKGDVVHVSSYASGSTAGGAVRRTIEKNLRHPDWNGDRHTYDYQLAKLKEPVPDSVKPVELNSDPDFPSVGSTFTFMGLGRTSDSASLADTLLQTDLDVMSTSRCDSVFSLGFLLGYEPIDIKSNVHLCGEPSFLETKGT